MSYIISNLIAALLFVVFGIIAYFIQRKNLKKAYNTLSLTLVGLFCALSVILTNVVGYSMIFGFKLMLGNFFIFLTGMLFGPMLGIIAGTVSDGVGILINLSGTFHFGFLLIKAFIGFCGGLVFWAKSNQHYRWKTVGIFSVTMLIAACLSPIFLYTLYGPGYTLVQFGFRLLRLPVEIILYLIFIFSAFDLTYITLGNSAKLQHSAWFLKNGKFKMKPKKSLREKYRLDLEGNRIPTRKQTSEYYRQINYNKDN